MLRAGRAPPSDGFEPTFAQTIQHPPATKYDPAGGIEIV
jgi:hypothetical protein